jgi:cytochrome c-type biogenesis protein CcmH
VKALPLAAIGVAVLAGGLGYWIAGSPGLPASPAPASEPAERVIAEKQAATQALTADPSDVPAWISLSNALLTAGQTQRAVEAMEVATAAMPGEVSLLVQQGVALVAHAEGEVVPAARLAFDRASQLDPMHPAPRYFLGLAWLQAGRPQDALGVWGELKTMTPPDAPWAEELDRMMGAAETMVILGVGGGGTPASMSPRPPAGDRQ